MLLSFLKVVHLNYKHIRNFTRFKLKAKPIQLIPEVPQTQALVMNIYTCGDGDLEFNPLALFCLQNIYI